MSDEIDRANDTAQLTNDSAMYLHRRDRVQTHQVWVGGVVVCSDCDAAIPSERLLAIPECERCIDCQVAYEKELRQWL